MNKMNNYLFNIILCPICNSKLINNSDLFLCSNCNKKYIIKNNIPILLKEYLKS